MALHCTTAGCHAILIFMPYYYIEIGSEDKRGRVQRVLLRIKAGEDEASTPHKVIESLLAKAAEDVVKKQLPPAPFPRL
jgi:hypothetical protein